MNRFLQFRFSALAILVIGLLIFGKSITYDFVWDDLRSHLAANRHLMKGDWKHFWSHAYDGFYIPITYTIWTAIKALATNGEHIIQPGYFHALNILTHIANALVILAIFRLFVKNSFLPLISSLLFLLHPLHAETVGWVSEFRGLLSSFWALLSLFYLFYSQEKTKNEKRYLLLAAVFYLLSLLSKPQWILLPGIELILLCVVYKKELKKYSLYLLPQLLFALPIVWITNNEQAAKDSLGFDIIEKLQLCGFSIAFYFYKTIVPLGLAPSYGLIPSDLVNQLSIIFWGALVFVGISILLLIKKLRIYAYFTLMIIASILPVGGLIAFNYQKYSQVADHYMYMGVFFFTFAILYMLKDLQKQNLLVSLSLVVVVCYGLLSFVQLDVWKDEFSIWRRSIDVNPKQVLALNGLGTELYKQKKLREAIDCYNEAIVLNPGLAITYLNRGNAYAVQNKFPLAMNDYNKALSIDPNYTLALHSRGLTYFFMGDFLAARKDLDQSAAQGYYIDETIQKELNRKLTTIKQ